MDGKHPVSLLGELSSKRKWGPPQYDVVMECGPGHAKSFIFKVLLINDDNSWTYSSTNILSIIGAPKWCRLPAFDSIEQ